MTLEVNSKTSGPYAGGFAKFYKMVSYEHKAKRMMRIKFQNKLCGESVGKSTLK